MRTKDTDDYFETFTGFASDTPIRTPNELDDFVVEFATKTKDDIIKILNLAQEMRKDKRHSVWWMRMCLSNAQTEARMLCEFNYECLRHGLEKQSTALALDDMCVKLSDMCTKAMESAHGIGDFPDTVEFPMFPKWPEEDEDDQ